MLALLRPARRRTLDLSHVDPSRAILPVCGGASVPPLETQYRAMARRRAREGAVAIRS